MAVELPELLTAEDVAAHLGIKVVTLYQWRLRKEGPPAGKVGGRLRFRRADVDAWVASRFAESGAA